jgi:peptidoglycan-N-acetylglucosamine deacetylase
MHKISFIIFAVLVFSCNSDVKRYPGISLSFDDRSVNEWFELRKLFNENNVRATFFITQPDSLDSIDIYKLKVLQADGHEIGFHGTRHALSEYYIKENSYSDYLDKEINSGMIAMNSLGFNCVSFAYPYGAKYWFTDFLLSRKFEFLMGVSQLNEGKDISKMDEIYYSFDDIKVLSALGFDNNSGVTKRMIDVALERAIVNQEVLLLYAHAPNMDEQDHGYSFDINLLKYIIQKANENDIGFYPMCELKN